MKYLLPAFLVVFMVSCSSDEATNNNNNNNNNNNPCQGVVVSYSKDVIPIINATCAISNCHVAGFANGNYTTYAGLKAKADNGSLKSRVVVSKNMPPSNTAGPKSLTADQIKTIECWIADGAKDN